MQAAGIPQRSISIVDGGFSVDISMQAMHELMSQPRPPTAVFTANDLNAIGCLVTALNSGLRVPEDVSIAGMDNIQPARYIMPPLTTVDIPMIELGKQAATRLYSLIEGKSVPPLTVLRHELVIRGSTAPPNQPPLPKFERKSPV
jgi:DNA-binding LacI/PurR family transcriptional regulator